MVISFERGVPFPENNWLAYRSIYVLEQWLRRIALAALMASHGTQILGVLPPEVRETVKKSTAQLRKRAHLGSDNASEALWATTFDELRRILTADSIIPTVRELTGLDRSLLDQKIQEITEIRNVIGHNRAVTTKTLRILEAANESLSHGVEALCEVVFRRQFSMFDRDQDGLAQVANPFEHPLAPQLEHWLSETALPFPPSGIRLGDSKFFYYLALIPEEYRFEEATAAESGVGAYADLEKLLHLLESVLEAILAITVTKGGHTVSVVWPKSIAADGKHDAIISSFLSALGRIWDGTDYLSQDARAVCHPKVWFHSAW